MCDLFVSEIVERVREMFRSRYVGDVERQCSLSLILALLHWRGTLGDALARQGRCSCSRNSRIWDTDHVI